MEIKISSSALKHGLTKEDILYAYKHCQRSRTVERSGNINNEVDFLLCNLPNGNFCELIAAQTFDEKDVYIFHADTPPSKEFLKTIEGE